MDESKNLSYYQYLELSAVWILLNLQGFVFLLLLFFSLPRQSLQCSSLSGSVLGCRVLWRRALILVMGFVLVFSQDSDSVSMKFSPPAVNKKGIPHFPFRRCSVTRPCWGSLSLPHWHRVLTLHSSNPGFIKFWQLCQYSPPKVGKKPSSTSMWWTNALINLNIAEELSPLYVKLCLAMRVLRTKSAHAICAYGMSYTIKLLTHVWHFHQYT